MDDNDKVVNEIMKIRASLVQAAEDKMHGPIEEMTTGEIVEDVIVSINDLITLLKDEGTGRGVSREASLAITQLETAGMWLERHLDVAEAAELASSDELICPHCKSQESFQAGSFLCDICGGDVCGPCLQSMQNIDDETFEVCPNCAGDV